MYNFQNNKDILKPVLFNNHDDNRIPTLKALLNKVGDDQKGIIQKELNYVENGLDGEKTIINTLLSGKVPCLILHDIVLENSYHNTEIDFLVITANSIIILEAKKIFGNITINSDGSFVRNLMNSLGVVYKKEAMYSPISQNRYHLEALKLLLQGSSLFSKLPIYTFVVIGNKYTTVNKINAPKDFKDYIIGLDALNRVISNINCSNHEIGLTSEEMIDLGNLLLSSNVSKNEFYINKYNLRLIKEDNASINIIDEFTKGFKKLNDSLYEALIKYRNLKANESNLPSEYFIFNDETLQELVINRPRNKADFMSIRGFGEKKFGLYGNDILSIVSADDYNYMLNQEESSSSVVEDPEIKEEPKTLIDALKQYRSAKSKEKSVPAYYIFKNDELDKLLDAKPTTLEELAKSQILPEIKFKLYGNDIVSIIKKFK